jgi:hypothetical protein
MKDAFGHGSNGIGAAVKDRRVQQAKNYGQYTERRQSAPQPISSNGMAAAALMNGLKSTMVPIHDGATGRSDSDNPRDAWSDTPGGDREPSR